MKLVVVDACRNLATPRAAGDKPELLPKARDFMKSLADDPPPRGIAALLSCQSGQFSHEVPKLGHGVFMNFVLEGLSGKADLTAGNRDGWVSVVELFNYASDQTEHYVDHDAPVRYSAQTPILRGDLPNYKLVRLEHVPGPVMPGRIGLSFTIRKETAGGGPLAGAEVLVMYRANAQTPEGAIAKASSGADGRCQIELPGYWAAMQGEFAALVRSKDATKRFPLDRIGDGRSWEFDVPLELAKEITNSIGMKLKLIPAGEFMMGSPEGEEERDDDEGPQHKVRITRPFYLGVYEVTQEQYEKIMGENPSSFKGASRPVENVSWDNAVEFCRRLSRKEGREYRLPTEAEWEYACRAGTTTRFYWGDSDAESVMKDYCWYENNAQESDWTAPHASEEGTQPVGQKRPNARGLYDMSGNVWEWCADWYDGDYYEDSPTDDPTGPASGSYRVGRGGGWVSSPRNCRSADRNGGTPGYRIINLGFRVASSSVDASSK